MNGDKSIEFICHVFTCSYLRIDLIIQAKEIIGRTFTRRGEKPITGAFECAEALDLRNEPKYGRSR